MWSHPDVRGLSVVADLDGDDVPEVIVTSSNFSVYGSFLSVLDIDGNLIWDYQFDENGSGPATIADFDGDGSPEIGVVSKYFYYVFEGDGSILWTRATHENSSGFTGSSGLAVEGGGAAEVVYADEETLWVFDGHSSDVELEFTEHASGTRYEYPTIADVDGDGSAEILVPHGRGSDGPSAT